MHCCWLFFFFFVPTASSPSPEQDSARPSSKNPLTWTVDDVVWFVKDADPHALGPHVELFRKHVCKRLPLVFLGNLSQMHRQSQEIQTYRQPAFGCYRQCLCSARLTTGPSKGFRALGGWGEVLKKSSLITQQKDPTNVFRKCLLFVPSMPAYIVIMLNLRESTEDLVFIFHCQIGTKKPCLNDNLFSGYLWFLSEEHFLCVSRYLAVEARKSQRAKIL